jgi:PAS domain S-box-containing protein
MQPEHDEKQGSEMGLTGKLLLPAAFVSLMLIAYLVLGWVPGAGPPAARTGTALVAAVGLLLLLGILALAIHIFWQRPLSALLRSCAVPPAAPDDRGSAGRCDEIRQICGILAHQRARIESLQSALELSAQQRQQNEIALRTSEERYALAMRGADDGLWEWDLQTNAFHLSQRWKAMLGFDEGELPDSLQAWRERVHPADLAAVEHAIVKHLEGATPRYQQQCRLLHKDGRYRWVNSLGSAIRHASGKASRLVGLDTDVTRIKRVEDILRHIVEGTSGTCGDEFFRALVRHFAGALDVPCAFVTECTGWPPRRVHTLAFWFMNEFRENIEYDLAGTPCEAVFDHGLPVFYPEGLGKLFPREQDFECYYGLPIHDSQGKVIGHMAFLNNRRMKEEEVTIDYVYRIFTARAAAEIERKCALERLTRIQATTNEAGITSRQQPTI